MIFRKGIAVFVSILFLSGCVATATGPFFQQIQPNIPALSEEHGRLYFMNPGLPHAQITVDKNQIGECKYGAFFWEDLPAGAHVVTVNASGDFGAWDEPIEVFAGHEHFILFKPRRGQAIAQGLFGLPGLLVEAAIATKGKSGSFQVEVLDVARGTEVRSNLVFFREGHSVGQHPPSVPVVAPPPTTGAEEKAPQAPTQKKPPKATRSIGGCSVEQILSMKGADLSDSQIKAACK